MDVYFFDVFGPVRAEPGKSIRLVSHSESKDAVIEITTDRETQSGTIHFVRERDITWTFHAPEEDGTKRGVASVARMNTVTRIRMGEEDEQKAEDFSPLNDMTFAIGRAPSGEWSIQLDGSLSNKRIEKDINELIVYLNRNWYPDHAVKVGDSWEFDPAWVRMIVEQDLKNAQTIGTMTLRQVHHTAEARRAVIDVGVKSSGVALEPGGKESRAQVELTGRLIVNLDTMLDEQFEIAGRVVSKHSAQGQTIVATMPLALRVTKSFVRD